MIDLSQGEIGVFLSAFLYPCAALLQFRWFFFLFLPIKQHSVDVRGEMLTYHHWWGGCAAGLQGQANDFLCLAFVLHIWCINVRDNI